MSSASVLVRRAGHLENAADVRARGQARRRARGREGGGLRRELVHGGHHVMLASPDGVEAELADQARLLEGLREAPSGIVAGRMLRVHIDAELH